MPDWLSGSNMLWVAAAWAVVVVGVGVAVVVVVVRLPPEHFVSDAPPAACHPALRVARNLLGGVLLLVGLALLALPGPGLLCVLAGVLLTDFPGKRRVERWVLAHKRVLAAANWVRAKAGRPPLVMGESAGS